MEIVITVCGLILIIETIIATIGLGIFVYAITKFIENDEEGY